MSTVHGLWTLSKKNFEKVKHYLLAFGDIMETSKKTKEELENYIKDPHYSMSKDAMEEIYDVGVYHGVFSGDNNGLGDRQNSVYGFIDTVKCLLQ